MIQTFLSDKQERFLERMAKMDDAMVKEYLDNPTKYLNEFEVWGKLNPLMKPWNSWRLDTILFKQWNFIDEQWRYINESLDYIIQNWEIKYWFWHSFIAWWKNVDYAWTILFKDWKIIKITNNSWHYKPSVYDKNIMFNNLKSSYNIDIDKIPFIWITN